MGHRANYVIVKNGKAKAYYDHWGALGCLFAIEGGPKAVEESASGNEETKELMDWAFAEGGFLLDHDEKRLVTFGYVDFDPDAEDGMPADVAKTINTFIDASGDPEKLFALIAPKWQGWTLEWNDSGTDRFAEHLAKRGIGTIKTQPPSKDRASDPYIVTIAEHADVKKTAKKKPAKKPMKKTNKKPAKKSTKKRR